MKLIDSHAHLTSPPLRERLDLVLAACAAQDVVRVISIASDLRDAEAAIEIARRHPMVSATSGIHPHEACHTGDEEVARLTRLLAEPEVVAIGEIGLDYHYDFADRASQVRLLSSQLEIAMDHDHPLVFHCRDAFDDAIALLERYSFRGRPVVFHCFTGLEDHARAIRERGWRISFAGIITFPRSAELRKIARDYPAADLMLETDAPYLSPVPVRHVRPNEPAHLVHTARFLAELREVSLEELAAQTTENTCRFFNLPA